LGSYIQAVIQAVAFRETGIRPLQSSNYY